MLVEQWFSDYPDLASHYALVPVAISNKYSQESLLEGWLIYTSSDSLGHWFNPCIPVAMSPAVDPADTYQNPSFPSPVPVGSGGSDAPSPGVEPSSGIESPIPEESPEPEESPTPLPSFSPGQGTYVRIKTLGNLEFASLYNISGEAEDLDLLRQKRLIRTAMQNDKFARGAVMVSGAALVALIGAPLAADAFGVIVGRVLFTAPTKAALERFQTEAATATVTTAFAHSDKIRVVAEFADALVGAGGVPRPIHPVWNISNDLARGKVIEEIIEGIGGRTLHLDFPVIDRFKNGVATSIKSMHLDKPTYQKSHRIRSTLKGYIDDVAAFNGAVYGGDRVVSRQIKGRALELILPHLNNSAQVQVIEEMAAYANSLGVSFSVMVL